jgi:2-polyprenyl-3-methyl-5-hydroxy-6-metoxy-1,4-benzoquinol methylase
VFDDLHRETEDPWDFATSTYESAKRAATIAALPDREFRAILEIGCSTGYLSQALSQKGYQVLALDVSAVAVGRASSRVGDGARICFRQAEVPEDWPPGAFDLIVFSEVLYFMTVEEIRSCAVLAHNSLSSDGICLLVNWTGQTDLPITGRKAASIFLASELWQCKLEQYEDNYLLQVLIAS